MYFYEVWVRSHRYQKNAALTYSSEQELQPGAIVQVPLQKELVMAIITSRVSKPNFTCKSITATESGLALPATSLKLFRWLQAYYPAPVGPMTQLFLPGKIAGDVEIVRDKETKQKPISLNQEQSQTLKHISGSGTFVLHGRTGSGKTRLYAALAQQELALGKSVILLSPEISLTPQLVKNFENLLGHSVVVLHSQLTVKQRSIIWAQLLTTKRPVVVIGPRSALFAPLSNIGLIVVDEVHEPAYKQEQQPYYYTPRVAAKLAQLHEAKLVLGSATPPVSEYYLAQQKNRPILELRELAGGQKISVKRTIIDIKDRTKFTKRSPHISDNMIEAIQSALTRGEQSMLYLNRRGTARLSLCQNCGWQAMCPHCDIPLTYHGDSHTLICHTCGIRESSHTICPSCGNTDIVLRTAGTKAITEEVLRLFPEARVQRFDTDNLKADRFEQQYQSILNGEVDILVGTQLLAKGLDLPRLSTLGVVLADSSLSIPDFTAQERTYQLIQQVLGRVGRGHTKHATAVIQTYNPDNATLKAALDGDWETFYGREIAERKEFVFPPFCHLLKLVCRRKSPASAEKACQEFAKELKKEFGKSIIIDGPTPAFHEKASGYYQWQLVIKASERSTLIAVIDKTPSSGWTYDIDPINLL